MRTCQMLGANAGFQSVIGTTSLIGSRPTASELMTTAGRVLRISAPTVGSKLTFQTSPRLGRELLGALDNAHQKHRIPDPGEWNRELTHDRTRLRITCG